MSTLADSFLDDLDDLGDSDEEEAEDGVKAEPSEMRPPSSDYVPSSKRKADAMDTDAAESTAAVLLRARSIKNVAQVRRSERFLTHMARIADDSEGELAWSSLSRCAVRI